MFIPVTCDRGCTPATIDVPVSASPEDMYLSRCQPIAHNNQHEPTFPIPITSCFKCSLKKLAIQLHVLSTTIHTGIITRALDCTTNHTVATYLGDTKCSHSRRLQSRVRNCGSMIYYQPAPIGWN